LVKPSPTSTVFTNFRHHFLELKPLDKLRSVFYKIQPMKTAHQQEIHYRLLNLLADEPRLRQQDMARMLGISIGKVNYCIAELASKGLIKIKRFKNANAKLPYTYLLTPHGMEEKGRITIRFLKRKLEEYDEIKRQIEALTQDVEQNGLQAMVEAELGDLKARLFI